MQDLGCPVRVISLKRSTERRGMIQNTLTKLGLEFTFFDAVDGNNLTNVELAKYSEKDAIKLEGRKLSLGEIGCALSHLRLYEELLASEHECLLILEDDILIGEMLLGVVKNRNNLPKDWELVNFYTWKDVEPIGEFIFDIYRPGKFKKAANMTAAYLVNRRGAEKLLKVGYPVKLAADDLTGRTGFTGLMSYGITPRVAAIRDTESTIKGRSRPNLKYRTVKRFKLIYKYLKTGEVGL